MSREKVYCSDCKHYETGYSDRVWEYCNKADMITYENHVGTYQLREQPIDKNGNNDCEDFEQK